MSEDSGFTPSGDTLVGVLLSEGAVLVPADSVIHYVKVIAVDVADNASAATAEAAILPLPARHIEAGSIGTDELAASFVLASQVIVGTPGAGRLELDGIANTMTSFQPDGTTETMNLDFDTGLSVYSGNIEVRNPNNSAIIIDADDTKLKFVGISGAVIAEMDSTGDFFGASLFIFRIRDDSGVVRFNMTGLGQSFHGEDGVAAMQSGSSGSDFSAPQFRVEPDGVNLAGRLKGEADLVNLGATTLLESPAINPKLQAQVRLESSSDLLAVPRVRVPTGTEVVFSNADRSVVFDSGTGFLRAADAAGTTDAPWIPLSYANSWSAYNDITWTTVPGHRITADGVVEFRGHIKGGTLTSGVIAVNLPAGARPPIRMRFPIITHAGTLAHIEITPGGDLHVYNIAGGGFGLFEIKYSVVA
jgi:hypothetical protein